MFPCGCANPICVVEGCQQLKKLREQAQPTPNFQPYQGTPVGAGDGFGTHIPRYLTESEVRRIVREEIAKLGEKEGDRE